MDCALDFTEYAAGVFIYILRLSKPSLFTTTVTEMVQNMLAFRTGWQLGPLLQPQIRKSWDSMENAN